MEVSRIIAEIDAQISKLQQARALLAGSTAPVAVTRGPGRPKGSQAVAKPKKVKSVKRALSPEARKKIADAQKRRWAAHRKESK